YNAFPSPLQVAAERANPAKRDPHFTIVHRFWQPETLCTPGEAVAEIRLLHDNKETAVRLSTRLLLLFDYLARHRRLGQSSSMIAAGLSVDPFTQAHGGHANALRTLTKNFSRAAIKQQIMRLRAALRIAFRDVGLNLDPTRVLVSE